MNGRNSSNPFDFNSSHDESLSSLFCEQKLNIQHTIKLDVFGKGGVMVYLRSFIPQCKAWIVNKFCTFVHNRRDREKSVPVTSCWLLTFSLLLILFLTMRKRQIERKNLRNGERKRDKERVAGRIWVTFRSIVILSSNIKRQLFRIIKVWQSTLSCFFTSCDFHSFLPNFFLFFFLSRQQLLAIYTKRNSTSFYVNERKR